MIQRQRVQTRYGFMWTGLAGVSRARIYCLSTYTVFNVGSALDGMVWDRTGCTIVLFVCVISVFCLFTVAVPLVYSMSSIHE